MTAADADRLSEVLDLVVIRGLVPGGFAARGPWVTRPALERPLKLIAMVSGSARLTTDRNPRPIALASGDVAIVREPTWPTLEGGIGRGTPQEIVPQDDSPATRLSGADLLTDAIFVGGRLELNRNGRALLAQALPPVAHVRAAADAANRLRAILELVFRELRERRPGAAFAIGQHGQLLVLEVLRSYLEQVDLPPGWLRLFTDEALAPAVALMHGQPDRRWRLDELARACAMSRTSFAERFRQVAGLPALTYLNRWRMLQARRALRESDVDIATLADRLGFASGSAFSAAFKREVGEPPGRYRRRDFEPETLGRP